MAINASALLVGGRPLDCDAQARRGDCRNSNHHMMARFCPGHCRTSRPPPLENGWCDFQDGQRFRCRPLVPPAEDLAARIRRAHPGDRVLCLLLLTKDDWPTVRSSVLHHGHLVGFEHLYVLDGSIESSEAVAFLQRARMRAEMAAEKAAREERAQKALDAGGVAPVDDPGDNFYQLLQQAKDLLPDNNWWVQ